MRACTLNCTFQVRHICFISCYRLGNADVGVAVLVVEAAPVDAVDVIRALDGVDAGVVVGVSDAIPVCSSSSS